VAEGQEFEPLNVTKVSPFMAENHQLAGFLLIPWLLSSSVGCEEFAHKFSTSLFMLRVLIDSPNRAKMGNVLRFSSLF
jgi:hypothetical protein